MTPLVKCQAAHWAAEELGSPAVALSKSSDFNLPCPHISGSGSDFSVQPFEC